MKNVFGSDYFRALRHNESEWHDLIKNEHGLVLTLAHPEAGDRILDVGCGKGRLGIFLLSQEPGIEMVFSDVTPEAAKYLHGYNFVQCSMAEMPFPDNYFDKIFCMHVIAHLPEGERAVMEAFRTLKKGGVLMILTPNKYFVYLMRLASFLRVIPPFKFDPTAKWLYSKSTLKKLLNSCDWTSVSQSYLQSAPRRLPFEWLRAKLILLAKK